MASRIFTHDCRSLDIRRLCREGFLVPDTRFEWVWRGQAGVVRGVSGIRVYDGRIRLVAGST